MTVRLFVLAGLLWSTCGLLVAARTASQPMASRLSALPLAFGSWQGTERPPLDEAILRILGADEYVSRYYATADGRVVDVYVAFYGAQRQGDAIHSPRHCLPGNGWQPVSSSIETVVGSLAANRIIVEKGGARQAVFYWYQGRGRHTHSEYANKLFLVVDGFRRQRTDGALIRVMTPVRGAEREADRLAASFIAELYPLLQRALP